VPGWRLAAPAVAGTRLASARRRLGVGSASARRRLGVGARLPGPAHRLTEWETVARDENGVRS
jgi:hypothetical protein